MSARIVAFLLLLVLTADLLAQQVPRLDSEQFLMLGDADLDGRLSIDEYKELLRKSPFAKDMTSIERMFQRLDSDQDGFLSATEYSQSFGPGRAGIPARPVSLSPATDAAQPADGAVTPEQTQFFESNIRPVLAKHCSECHFSTSEKLQGGLLLDRREGFRRGGNSGPIIVPGQPTESVLIRALRYRDDLLQMPPKGKLPDAVIADFETWVKMGAPDPRTDPVGSESDRKLDPAKACDHWAFRSAQKHNPPTVHNTDWPRGDLDQFLLAELESRGLVPVADASRQRWLRRITFDLIGLPPTPQQLDEFLNDDSPNFMIKVVDRLLGSPHFGERWGRHWLDVARYAESSGKTNFSYPQAWRYRDWVIASFNADKPYDQFVQEQVAGDLLSFDNARQHADQLIATGFLAIGSKAHDSENRRQFVVDVIDEQIEATTRAFLGLTVACARCHDHKLDPISQRDYYALSGIFRSTRTCSGTLAGVFPNFNASPLIELPTDADVALAISQLTPDQRRRMEQRVDSLIAERDSIPSDESNRDRVRRTNSMLATLRHRLLMDRPDDSPRAFAMGVQERDEPIDSPLYIRGELDRPGAIVPRGLIHIPDDNSTTQISSGSGRREFASWLASKSNPLTARVIVNRVWLHLFGRGLVATPDNFGVAGARPSNPNLLDTLAVDFMNDGWSIKRLIRRVVLSRAYGLDSIHDSRNFDADPDNDLIWRMSKRRLEAEILRDTLLFVGGQLETKPPVGSAVARMGEGLAFFVRVDGLDVSDMYRSVYLPVIRDQLPESLTLFDFADPSLVTGARATTTGPAQALMFMNGTLAIRQADALTERVWTLEDDDARRVEIAYRIVYAREPTIAERDRAAGFLRDFVANASGTDPKKGAWSAFCQALFASAEFRYVD